jgi:predicted RND superfamily exporter protein
VFQVLHSDWPLSTADFSDHQYLPGAAAYARAEINALLVLVVPVIWTIATLDAFHLYSRTVIHARRNCPNPAKSASRALFLPCLLTTVTTAGCFLTLTLLDTSPLTISFGIWSTAGAVLTFTVGTKLL